MIAVFNPVMMSKVNYTLLFIESLNIFIVSIVLGIFDERLWSFRMERLVYLSNRDVLTGIYNRLFFMNMLFVNLKR